MIGSGGSTTTLKAVLLGEDKSMGRTFDNVGKGLDDVNKKGSILGDTFGKLGIADVVAGAGLAVGAFAVQSVKAASDLNETVNKSNVIFGDNAKAIEDWGSRAWEAIGMSKNEAIGAASSFGDMFQQLGFARDAAAKMSTDVVELAADLGSFHNLDTDDVTERITAAFRGEYDSLQALIPNISAARVEQEAQRLGLVKSTVDVRKLGQAREAESIAQKKYNDAVKEHGKNSDEARAAGLRLSKAQDATAKAAKGAKDDISEQAKAQAILSIVQKDGAAAAGDFAKTSDGLANQQKILKAAFEDTKAEVGQALLPILTDLGRWFIDEGVPAIKDATKWWNEHGDDIQRVASVIGKALAWMVESSARQFGAFMDGVEKVGDVFTWLWNNVTQPVTTKIIDALNWVTRTFASMLRGMSKVPGFGWAKDAADKLDAAAGRAEKFRDRLQKIPPRKRVDIDASTAGAMAAIGAVQLKVKNTKGKTVTIKVRYTSEGRLPNGGLSLVGGITRAAGGPVFGPGTSTSDSILAFLSNNEHVLSAKEVAGFGGHRAVEAMRAAARTGRFNNAARLAMGGPAAPSSAGAGIGYGFTVGADQDIVLNVTSILQAEGRELHRALKTWRLRSGQPLRLEEKV